MKFTVNKYKYKLLVKRAESILQAAIKDMLHPDSIKDLIAASEGASEDDPFTEEEVARLIVEGLDQLHEAVEQIADEMGVD